MFSAGDVRGKTRNRFKVTRCSSPDIESAGTVECEEVPLTPQTLTASTSLLHTSTPSLFNLPPPNALPLSTSCALPTSAPPILSTVPQSAPVNLVLPPTVYIETETGSVKSAHFESEKASDNSQPDNFSSVFGEPTSDEDVEAGYDEDEEFNDKNQRSPLIPRLVLLL